MRRESTISVVERCRTGAATVLALQYTNCSKLRILRLKTTIFKLFISDFSSLVATRRGRARGRLCMYNLHGRSQNLIVITIVNTVLISIYNIKHELCGETENYNPLLDTHCIVIKGRIHWKRATPSASLSKRYAMMTFVSCTKTPNKRLMRTYHWISLFMAYIKSAN
jgi:hypothetical protein